jgi:signal transduction histidine kinase
MAHRARVPGPRPDGATQAAISRGSVRPAWSAPAWVSWGLAVPAIVLSVGMVVLAVADGDLFMIVLAPGPVVAALMGGLVAARRPGQRMGPLLSVFGLLGAVCSAAFAYAHAAVVHDPAVLPAGQVMMWMTSWDYVPPIAFLVLILPLVFPDGRLVSPRWRPALWAAAAFVALAIVGNAFEPESMGGWFGNRPNPYAIPSPVFRVLLDVAYGCGLVTAIAAAASLVVRWRRGGLVVRQQLKWLLAPVPVIVVTAVIVQFFPDAVILGVALGMGTSLLTALAIGLAVLRYRLYEIDFLLNRAVLYGVMTVVVALAYLAVVGVARGLFGMNRGLAVQVVATVLAAAAFWPVRDGVQRRVDRLLYGDRRAPYEALARLGRRVEEAADTDAAMDCVVTTIADSLRLPYAAVELRLGDSWQQAAAYGRTSAQVVAFPLVAQRETVGRLLVGTRAPVEQLRPDDERLLADLARQAGPAVYTVALRRALDASQADLATTREEERRRLRRDLHDGLGPTLAGLTLGLDTALRLAGGHPEQRELLGRLKVETQRAVTDVRRIVYGLRPPALDELGLPGALREEVRRLQCEVPGLTVGLTTDLGLVCLPAVVEVACYRIVAEALTNVARHSSAACCTVRVQLDHESLHVEVCDDGAGPPDGWQAGVGVMSMRERAAELGGTLLIEPRLPRGTRVAARLPVRTGRSLEQP